MTAFLHHDGVRFDLPRSRPRVVGSAVLGALAGALALASVLAAPEPAPPPTPIAPTEEHAPLEGWRIYAPHDLATYDRVRRDALYTAVLHGLAPPTTDLAPAPSILWQTAWAEAVHLAADRIPPRAPDLPAWIVAIHDAVDAEVEAALRAGWAPSDQVTRYEGAQAAVRSRLAGARVDAADHLPYERPTPRAEPTPPVDAGGPAVRLELLVLALLAAIGAALAWPRAREVRVGRGQLAIAGRPVPAGSYTAEARGRRVRVTLADGSGFDTPDLGFAAARSVAAALSATAEPPPPAPPDLVALRRGAVDAGSQVR